MKLYAWTPYKTDCSTGLCVVVAENDDEAFKVITQKNEGYAIAQEYRNGEDPDYSMIRREDLAMYDEGQWVKPEIHEIKKGMNPLIFEVGGGG